MTGLSQVAILTGSVTATAYQTGVTRSSRRLLAFGQPPEEGTPEYEAFVAEFAAAIRGHGEDRWTNGGGSE